jgi:hypothetical protein
MDSKNWILIFFLLTLTGFGVGYVLDNSIEYGLCVANAEVFDAGCVNFYERVGNAVYYGMGALALGFLMLLVVPQAFPAWKKFAIWFVPIATFIFVFYQEPRSDDWVSPSPEMLFRWIAALYVLATLVVVGLHTSRTNRIR